MSFLLVCNIGNVFRKKRNVDEIKYELVLFSYNLFLSYITHEFTSKIHKHINNIERRLTRLTNLVSFTKKKIIELKTKSKEPNHVWCINVGAKYESAFLSS